MGPVDLLVLMLIAPVLITPSRITEVNPFFVGIRRFWCMGIGRGTLLNWT